MFDSLKKKFAEASGKLRNKVEEDAKKEDNIDLTEEKIEDVEVNSVSDESDKVESDINSDLDSSKDDIDEELEERKSGFLSFFKRNKKDDVDESKDLSKDYGSDSDLSGSSDDIDSKDVEDIILAEDAGSDEVTDVIGSEDEEISAEEISDVSGDNEESVEKKSSKSRRSLFGRKKDDSSDVEGTGGFLSFIREKTISESDLDDILFELELGLLEADVAMDVSSTIVESLKNDLVGKKIKRSSDIDAYVFNALKNVVSSIIDIEGPSMTELLEAKVAEGEPLVVMLIGINGTGKTTTIGKLCNFYLKKGYTPVIAASDTFRAGAIEQIGHHADNLGVKLIKHEKGSDPAAVAFDAVQHAKAKGKEIVFIDTAGRMQTNVNLMDEMKKIRRVSKPDLVVFVGDALTGNDATEQARKFKESIDIDGIILTKADADSKGGASLSIGYVVKKPILFLGMGQSYDDIKEYDAEWMLNQIFS